MNHTIHINISNSDDKELIKLLEHLQEQQKEVVRKHDAQILTAEVFIFLVIFLQVVVCFLQAKYPQKFQEVTFVFLTIYPLSVIIRAEHLSYVGYIFVLLWVFWGSRSLYLMYKAMGPPFSKKKWILEKHIPQIVYQWFLRTHRICYSVAGISMLLFYIFPAQAFQALFISLYFGVLGRDCADVCTNKISSSIGFIHHEVTPENICALCGVELMPTLELLLGEKKEDDPDIVENPVVTLDCGHVFHKRCILGWTMVGKKDTCPYCREKVKFGQFLTEKAWNSPRLEIWWVGCLVVMRHLLIWYPMVTLFALYFLKVFHFETLVDSEGNALF